MISLKDKIFESQNNIKHYVDGILVNPDNEILLLQRAGYMKQFPGKWGFVGGSIDEKDKSSKAAIIREIEEETGIKLTWNEEHSIKSLGKQNHKDDGTIVSDTEYFLIQLETTPDIKISREHSRYKWMSEDDCKEKQTKMIPDVFHYIQKIF